MYGAPGIVSVVLFYACSAACAQDMGGLLSAAMDGSRGWRDVNGEMTPEAYNEAWRHNLRNTRHTLREYSESLLADLRVPEAGVRAVGTAIGLARGKASLSHDFMSLEVTDAADSDRMMYLRFKFDW